MATLAAQRFAHTRDWAWPRATAADPRFRQLLGEAAWNALPSPVRARFGRKALATQTISYVGEIVECRMSRAGWAFAQACRLIGSPLPVSADSGVATTVCVTEDEGEGGQFWTRQYGRHHGFPQVIHSSKRFAGPTGLEEYIGRGFGVALCLRVEEGALYFDSDHYFWRIGRLRLRLRLPRWLSPGRLSVGHIDCDHGWFAFTLALDHPWFGPLIHQCGLFTEYRPAEIG